MDNLLLGLNILISFGGIVSAIHIASGLFMHRSEEWLRVTLCFSIPGLSAFGFQYILAETTLESTAFAIAMLIGVTMAVSQKNNEITFVGDPIA